MNAPNKKKSDEGNPLYTALAVLLVLAGIGIVYFAFFSNNGNGPIVDPSVLGSGHTKGNENASVTVVEFGDFQCPACGFAFTQLEQILPEYEGRVKFIFKQFPLSSAHPFAYKAAEASECADEQGKFWELHDIMYQKQPTLAIPDLKGYALDLGLDVTQFGQCIDSGKYSSKVASDIALGNSLGVNSTPTFFVNGKSMGNLTIEQWRQVLNEALS